MAATASGSTHRTVALIGGSGSGKTTLAEALLHSAGATSRMGSVEQGTTVCDHEPEEIARGTTLEPFSRLALVDDGWRRSRG